MSIAGCNENLIVDKKEVKSPTITSFSPATASIGEEVTISGENLTNVNKIMIGGGQAVLKYKVNSSQLVAKITNECKSGKIEISSSIGSSLSSTDFTMQYVKPIVTSYPTEGKSGTQVLITGQNLDAVTNIYFGDSLATIRAVSPTEILLTIPVFKDDFVDILLQYNTLSGISRFGTTGKPFKQIKPIPIVTSFPSEGMVGSSISIEGTDLTQIDKAYIGTYRATIANKTDGGLTLIVPTQFTNSENVTLKLIYQGDKELLLTNQFNITVSGIIFWENKTIFANDPTTTNNFFNAITGTVYSPCDYATQKNNIYLLLSITGGGMRISNPNNSNGVTKAFKCGATTLPDEKMPRNIRLRRLLPSIAEENAIIQKVKAKTMQSLSVSELAASGIDVESEAGFPTNSTGVVDYKGVPISASATNAYEVGSVILMMEKGLNAPNTIPTVKVGLIHITNIATTNATTDKKSSITFDCYYQK